MRTPFVLISSLLITAFSCQKQPKNTAELSIAPGITETEIYVVPKDSMAEPKVIPIVKPWVVPAGMPTIVPFASNVHRVGKPQITLAGTLRLQTPGQDSFSLPTTVPAIGRTILAGSAEVIMAKDAQAKDQNAYNFISFGKIQGLINESIFSLFKDKKGNLWIGSYGGGVCKYDGVSFTCFTEREGLPSNVVVSILEDKNENIWFGTLGGGLCKYDGKNFTLFTEKDGLGSNFIHCMAADKRGNLWIGTVDGGLVKYTPADYDTVVEPRKQHQLSGASFTRFTVKEGLNQNTVASIFEDKNGDLWIGSWGRGVCKYDGKSFTLFSEGNVLSRHIVKTILEDKSGNLWFGTWANGVFKFDGTYFTQYTVREGLSHDNVRTSVEDKTGTIWFGTEGGGITCYDRGDSLSGRPPTFTHFTEWEGLSHNLVNTVIKDNDDIVWIGTHNNLNKYLGKSITHFTASVGITGTINCVIEARNGNLWFGGSTGLNKFDGKFISHFTAKEGLLQDNVNTLLEDSDGNLWIGTYNGVTKYDGKSFSHFLGGNVQSILQDGTGNLWFGLYGGGMIKFDGQCITNFTTNEGLISNWVWDVEKDKKGNLWIGTADKGVCMYRPFDGDKGFVHYITKEANSSKNIYSILEDKNNNLWFATGGSGVVHYDPEPGFGERDGPRSAHSGFEQLTKGEGLITDFVNGILEDKHNDLWFCTSNGISKLSRKYQQISSSPSANYRDPIQFKNIEYADGFHGSAARQNAICEDRNGTIWIGTNDRLTAIKPDEEIADSIPPNIQLTGLALFNKYLPWQFLETKSDTSILLGNGERIHDLRFGEVNKWNLIPQQLSLAYDVNHVTFRYVGITTRSPKKVRYQYMLEGLDKGWSTPTDRTEVSYNNLSHGGYTFKVKATNGEGYRSGEVNYPFQIRPPWWLSSWAYAFYGCCFIGAIILVDRYQRKRLLQKERALFRERELEQAKEIEKAYHQLEQSHENLKATQTQLIQSEKMASLGELTAGIAHEIQNPLNFVNNFSELNKELVNELQQELRNGKIEDASGILANIKENEEKINHHGKRADSIVKSMLKHRPASPGQKEPTAINALCDEYLRLSYRGLHAKDKSFKVRLETVFDPSVDKVNVVPQDIGRVVLNLTSNAFYAVGEKQKQNVSVYEPIVSVTTLRLAEGVEIKVKDNGNGIPENVKEKIFQPFFTTKPTGQGTGLGLSLSYDIVKAHGGELKVETTVGAGSTFTIYIPIQQ